MSTYTSAGDPEALNMGVAMPTLKRKTTNMLWIRVYCLWFRPYKVHDPKQLFRITIFWYSIVMRGSQHIPYRPESHVPLP